jgi:hypothetical protein
MTTENIELLPGLEPLGFNGVVGYLKDHVDQAKEDLDDYYTNYTGRFFEDFSACGAPDAFDANDLVACAALSTPIEGMALDALWTRIEDLNTTLTRCPARHVSLTDVDHTSDEYIALTDLYEMIRAIPGMGKVRTSKLLASKRPALVPIRDRHVEAILGAGDTWWEPWRQLLRHPDITALVERATPGANDRATNATLLRRLDVILWKEAKRRANRT